MAIPLIIAGQARAGTTALAHVLATNPDIELYTSGSEAHLLECDELEHDKRCAESAASLRAAIAASGAYLCAAKRPWCEEDPEFFAAHFPDAIYILCRRNAADLVRSRQDCALTWTVQGLGPAELHAEFARRTLLAAQFARRMQAVGAIVIEWDYDAWIAAPRARLAELALRLAVPDEWDTSELWTPGQRTAPVGAPAQFRGGKSK